MFFLVDAFTLETFRGNPAGVYVMKEDDTDFTAKRMQDIASYYNWSEISYVKELGYNKYKIRWFSPRDEAPLCGHATLAAAHVIMMTKNNTNEPIEFIHNNGSIKAYKADDDFIYMSFPVKPITIVNNPSFEFRKIFSGIDNGYENVFEDENVYIIVLNKASNVKKAVPNTYEIKKIEKRAVILTSSGFTGYDFCSRYFAPRVGLYEDPVCGSAHCRLAPYWGKVLNKNDMLAFQSSRRTGVLKVQLRGEKVIIGGRSIITARFF
ncbi:MAG: PhzF family phenazine biosynthesis protein [Holosporales bacterium]|jgi:predicted PhzF superfamily epimerase YddE/YHI9|nr:PhzF family phenazine biosynthesis protein [Holosporales bacterium]